MVRRLRVLHAARAVAGNHYRGNLPAAGVGVTATGAVVAIVVGDDDGVVALGPERRGGYLAHQVTEISIAHRHEVLVLRVADAAAVQAVRRVAMHVVALV